MRKTLLISILAVSTASQAMALQSLRDVPKVENGLFAIVVADKIRKECDTISGRVIKALGQMRSLANYAQSLGYTEEEIRAYTDSDVEKARMDAKRSAYLVKEGVVESDPETYCAVGRAEIRKSTDIGALLRAR